MKLILLFLLVTSNVYAGTCTSISRTNNAANTVLTSTKYNADHNAAYNAINAADGGCVTDGTLEDGALNTTDFAVPLQAIKSGCALTKAGDDTIQVDANCRMAINGTWVKTATATTESWGCSGCSAEATDVYYVYGTTSSTSTALDLLISTTAPNSDGYDGSNNRVIGSFANHSGAIQDNSLAEWRQSGFARNTVNAPCRARQIEAKNTSGGTLTTGSFETREFNQLQGECGYVALADNQLTLAGDGKYNIHCAAPFLSTDSSQTQLVRDPNGSPTILITGTSIKARSADNDNMVSMLEGVIDLTSLGATAFELQSSVSSTKATDGAGQASNLATAGEVFTSCTIWRLN